MKVIEVKNLSKAYQLGSIGTGTLSRDIERFLVTKVLRKEDPFLTIGETNDRTTKGQSDIVWSLKDVSFDIHEGDAVGIVGKNGAGKSTMLKLLSRVTSPTQGSIKVKGRIASLLEVGTGFHPELSGRENIFLNGAILGMRKKEIERKFDEIVDFSGVERYIDTPVKRYSSGMYVRLAFAVAAHLESEILIIDEVLAVGDAEFQKKCLGKMKDVTKGEGRTVLFVSHNMAAVKSLCNKGIVLEHGQLKLDTDSASAIKYYLSGADSEQNNLKTFSDIGKPNIFQLNAISFCNKGQSIDEPLTENSEIEFTTEINILSSEPNRYIITYHLYNDMGEALFSFSHHNNYQLKTGINQVTCHFPAGFFQSGTYMLSLFVVEDNRTAIHIEKDIVAFTVVDAGRTIGVYMGREPGFIKPQFNWTLK
jgi:lipopolysaccharide transport system ATP-binding protein